jgi:hypothetical protein
MKAIITYLSLLCLCGSVLADPEPQSKGAESQSPGLAAARKFVGSDPAAEFRKNRDSGVVPFYSTGSLVSGDNFPGLSQEEVDRLITEERRPCVRRFQDDPSPFFVGDDFSAAEYWEAVSEYLTAYNRLVLEELKRQKPNQPLQRTPDTAPAISAESDPRRR